MNTTKITVELGEKEFSVEVRELEHEEKKGIAQKLRSEQEKVESYESAKASLRDLSEQYDVNKELLLSADMPLTEKVKMLWEQKTLMSHIKALRPSVEQKAKEPVFFEEIAKEQFGLMMSGTGKDGLMKEMENSGKTYREILGIILQKVQEAKEKKSSSS